MEDTLTIYLDFSGKDSVLVSNMYRWHSGLEALAASVYRNPPEELAIDKVKQRIDNMQLAYEGGMTGNHAQIALRNKLRKEVTAMFKRILAFLQSVAVAADIPALIQAGFLVRTRGNRRKSSVSTNN